MGMTGRWIDSLKDAERDRIIEHPDPSFLGKWWWDYVRDCGCLVGCVKGRAAHDRATPECDIGTRRWNDTWATDVGERFPYLTERFGAPRMWRVVKARAAKRNRVEIGAPCPEPEYATP